MSGLVIPAIPDDADLLQAALAYAAAGWYVGPLLMGELLDGKRPDAKNPGRLLGRTWQSRTSREQDEIISWFAGTGANGVFLHAGRSGAVIFDVDHPELVPEILARFFWGNPDAPLVDRIPRIPFQSTRPDEPGRGHYLALQPLDRVLGNGHGSLGNAWGEVRGNNGIIVAEPTQHESTGRYRWETDGIVPPLTQDLDSELPSLDATAEEIGPASDERVAEFLNRCIQNDNENLRKGPLKAFEEECEAGASRHDTATKIACQLMREARMGYYSGREAANELYKLFLERLRGTPRRFPRAEYKSIIAWAVGQAETIDVEFRRKEMDDRLTERDQKKRRSRKSPPKPKPREDGLDPDPFGLLDGKDIDPDKYFYDKTIGLDVQMLVNDILNVGPLATGRDGYFWEYADGVWRPYRYVVRDRCVKLLGPRYRTSHTSNASDVVSEHGYDIECDPVPDYLNCRNGMVDWKTGKLSAHDPGYMSTVQFPWDWDPQAECPMFDKFINEALSPDYAELAWQMIGYLLYSGNPRQIAFLLRGQGGEGKGTLLRVITAMLGKENISTESLTSLNQSKFSAVNLFGKIANIAGDIESTFQTETNMFKSLTGEDMFGAEHKYGSRFNFENWAVPVFSANKIPGSADVTKGYLRRWLMIKFTKSIAEEDIIIGYSNMLIAEAPGIAAKALAHLQQVISHGFKRDGEIAEGLEEFALHVDQVRLWVDECCERISLGLVGQPYRVPRNDLYKSYRAWAQENNNGALKASEFYTRLESAGFRPTKISGVRYFEGLRVVVLGMTGTNYDKSMPDTGDSLVDKWSTTG